jgi:hypothetical protein
MWTGHNLSLVVAGHCQVAAMLDGLNGHVRVAAKNVNGQISMCIVHWKIAAPHHHFAACSRGTKIAPKSQVVEESHRIQQQSRCSHRVVERIICDTVFLLKDGALDRCVLLETVVVVENRVTCAIFGVLMRVYLTAAFL